MIRQVTARETRMSGYVFPRMQIFEGWSKARHIGVVDELNVMLAKDKDIDVMWRERRQAMLLQMQR